MVPGYPGAKGLQPVGHQIHQHTFPQISKPVGHPLCYSPDAMGSLFFPSSKPWKTPQQHVSAGHGHPPSQATQKSPVWLFYVHLVSKTRDICPAHLICGYLPDWTPMQAKAKKGHPISSCHMHNDTLAQGASVSLAVSAKGMGVLQIWMPDPVEAHKFLGLTDTNYSLPFASSLASPYNGCVCGIVRLWASGQVLVFSVPAMSLIRFFFSSAPSHLPRGQPAVL